jgi:lysophospholipase L1-like esterase
MKGVAGRKKSILSHGSECLSRYTGKPLKRYPVCLTLTAIFLLLVSAIVCDEEVYGMAKKKHVVLLGASVGNAWNIEALPDRLKQTGPVQDYRFEFAGDYQFDKSTTLKSLLARKEDRPDTIIIKECAAYFPGDLNQYQTLIKTYIEECLKTGVIPVLATVAPVREPGILKLQYWKNIVKRIIYPSKPGVEARLSGLTAYNDWVRTYTAEQKLAVLDLEKALRISESDRRLKPDLDGGDGLHLNAQAYAVLDQIVMPALEQAFSKK